MKTTGRTPCVVLISPGILKWTDMDFGLPHLVSIGGYLLREVGEQRVRVELLDLNYEGTDHQTLLQTIESFAPLLCIGVSTYSSFDYLRAMTLGRFLKQAFPDTTLVTGGYHASALPEDCAFEGSPYDVVIQGEGERSMTALVETLLGGGRPTERIMARDVIEDLDSLPYYRWDLLDRYWPRAYDIGRKLQVYLSRGCVYHCTFCMERAKSGYSWRAYSPERAVEELRRLGQRTDLSRWVVNLADPLFGFKRSWRREVLEGILEHDIQPRQFWTLTRSDDLDDVDVKLLAQARFSIGIGLESGSPRMLRLMQKGNTPEAYLDALRGLAVRSRTHGLNWAANIIIGHPGETMESMQETHTFVKEVFATAKETCGWLSIDPFRLYPGAHVHEARVEYEAKHGARFHHPEWWKSWYDGPFKAEHVDPSHTLDFEGRVNFMYAHYGALVGEIQARFRGQGRDVDRVYKRSLEEQRLLLSPATRDTILARGRRARGQREGSEGRALSFPVGLHVRDPAVRRREEAVRRLLEQGVLRSDAIIEAVLQVAPEPWLGEAGAAAMLRGESEVVPEGVAPGWIGLGALALGLEALGPGPGTRVADLLAVRGYVSALLARCVGDGGEVVAVHPLGKISAFKLRLALGREAAVKISALGPMEPGLKGQFDGLLFPAALPRAPARLLPALHEGGRLVTFLGPRFRPQDEVCLTRRGEGWSERRLGRVRVPIVAAPGGWLTRPRA